MFEEMTMAKFRALTGVESSMPDDGILIPLRGFTARAKVTGVRAVPKLYLEKMLRATTLVGSQIRPYRDAEIYTERVSPFSLSVVQTFVLRRKYMDIIETFDQVFDGFHVASGVAKKMPMIIYGRDDEGKKYLAHYLPPIVEVSLSGCRYLLDGTHRGYITGAVGTTIETVVIKGVIAPPCGCPISWEQVRVVDEKPPKAERFINNDPTLFRFIPGLDG